MKQIEAYNKQLEGAFDLIRNMTETDYDNIPVDPSFAGLTLDGTDAAKNEELIVTPDPTDRAPELNGESTFTLADRGYEKLPNIERQQQGNENRFAEKAPSMIESIPSIKQPKAKSVGIDTEVHPKTKLHGVEVYADNCSLAKEQARLRDLGLKGIIVNDEKYWVAKEHDLPRLTARLMKEKIPFAL